MSEEAEVTISYLILCHDSPDRIVRLVTRILSDDETGQVVIHFDKNSSRAKFNELKTRLYDASRCHIVEQRVKCGWGQWSLVEATFLLICEALNNKTTHYYLVSENCYPVKPIESLKKFLYNHKNNDFIECEDASWVTDGVSEGRYQYLYFFNKKKYPRLHRWGYKMQSRLLKKRKTPKGLAIRFGSQWWCLTNRTLNKIVDSHYAYRGFFVYTWIPDEMYIQSLIWKLSRKTVISKTLTYYNFDECGHPESVDKLKTYPESVFFARKFIN